MDANAYDGLMEAIKDSAARIFEFAETEEDVCRLERAIHDEVAYLAAIAQSKRVEPPAGWDPLGR
ncbi:hypothetical protein [Rubneribacter sp.]|nr:hypothetical protein [Candidatus Rubneribacter avistercoris]